MTAAHRPATLVTPEAVVLDLEPAGIASRALARLVDAVVQGLIVVAAVVAAALVGSGSWPVVAAVLVVVAAAVFAYPVAFELGWGGRTPGKAALGLRVVSEDGAPVTVAGSFARSALQLVDLFLVPGGAIAIAFALFGARNQRLGDLVGGTLVLRDRTAARTVQAVTFLPPPGWESYAASLDVGRLGEHHYELVRSFLLRIPELTPESRAALAWRLARPTAERLGHRPDPQVHPELFLACVAAAYQRRSALAAAGGGR